jgi:hypothetical protein
VWPTVTMPERSNPSGDGGRLLTMATRKMLNDCRTSVTNSLSALSRGRPRSLPCLRLVYRYTDHLRSLGGTVRRRVIGR